MYHGLDGLVGNRRTLSVASKPYVEGGLRDLERAGALRRNEPTSVSRLTVDMRGQSLQPGSPVEAVGGTSGTSWGVTWSTRLSSWSSCRLLPRRTNAKRRTTFGATQSSGAWPRYTPKHKAELPPPSRWERSHQRRSVEFVPRLSEFYGIVVYMYWSDHHPPHFHASTVTTRRSCGSRTVRSSEAICHESLVAWFASGWTSTGTISWQTGTEHKHVKRSWRSSRFDSLRS